MTDADIRRGGAPVGLITELSGVEAASIIYLRLWSDGPDSQSRVWNDFVSSLGSATGREVLRSFEELCNLCKRHARRPMMRHNVNCKCIGSDEACFANFIATAAGGEREDAMLIATLLVRADMAPVITALATQFGLALRQMKLCAPRSYAKNTSHDQSRPTTLH